MGKSTDRDSVPVPWIAKDLKARAGERTFAVPVHSKCVWRAGAGIVLEGGPANLPHWDTMCMYVVPSQNPCKKKKRETGKK